MHDLLRKDRFVKYKTERETASLLRSSGDGQISEG